MFNKIFLLKLIFRKKLNRGAWRKWRKEIKGANKVEKRKNKKGLKIKLIKHGGREASEIEGKRHKRKEEKR